MIQYLKTHRDQLSYVLLAELSLLVTILVVYEDLPNITVPSAGLISNLVFALICILGIIAGIAPKYCSFSGRSERHGEGVAGHHPDCGHFEGHTVMFRGKAFCAGCSGLVIGGLLSLIGLVSGFSPFGLQTGFWIGALLVCLGLAQHFIDLGSAWVHLLLNVGFVLGDWLMFMAVQRMALSFLVSAYFLAVTVFWIYARIRASQWTHVVVCRDCTEHCVLRFE